MHYFEYAEKDATLYERSGSQNTGIDEILEVTKDVSAAGVVQGVSRIVIKFDTTYISSSISSGLIPSSSYTKFFLNLYDANSRGLNVNQNLYAYPVSQSWDNGFGKEDNNPIIGDGCSWFYRDNDIVRTMWTGSMTGSGGTWYEQHEASQSFNNEASDVRMDVTNIVWEWVHGNIPNDGFMVKRSGSVGNLDDTLDEGSSKALGTFSFFSRETHTVYQPKLEAVWDDSKWITGSLEFLTPTELEDLRLYPRSLRDQYKEASKVKFRVVGRPLYPEKTFSATEGYSTGYNTAKMLPSGSTFYQVVDVFTDDIIIPYGTGSRVSCDSTGNYINLDLKPLLADRFYRIDYKIISGSGTADETIQFFNYLPSFKVVK
tara:strand:- start:5316 stop:6434 length:1119 start_codon:yes stop_codon:yes gene_type:complete